MNPWMQTSLTGIPRTCKVYIIFHFWFVIRIYGPFYIITSVNSNLKCEIAWKAFNISTIFNSFYFELKYNNRYQLNPHFMMFVYAVASKIYTCIAKMKLCHLLLNVIKSREIQIFASIECYHNCHFLYDMKSLHQDITKCPRIQNYQVMHLFHKSFFAWNLRNYWTYLQTFFRNL